MSVDRWLLTPQPLPDAQVRLYCIPHAGGGTSAFIPWARYLAPDIELTAVCLPGRERHVGAPPINDMAPLASDLVDAVLPTLREPYALFGHSLGALVAFELGSRLQELGRPPARLIASSSIPPHLVRLQPPLYRMADDELLAQLIRYGGMPSELADAPEVYELMLPALRADLRIAATYEASPAQRLHCPVTALGGVADRFVAADVLARWGDLTTAEFTCRLLPGAHFYLTTHRDHLLHTLRAAALEGAGARPVHVHPEEARA